MIDWKPTKEDLDWTQQFIEEELEGRCKKLQQTRIRWSMTGGELGLDFKTKEYAFLEMNPMLSELILRVAKCLEELGWSLIIGKNTIRVEGNC